MAVGDTELLRNSVCASVAAAATAGLFNPLDTLRVRWQLSPVLVAQPLAAGASLPAFARGIVAAEGLVGGLWRPGFVATMSAMATSGGIRMGCYPHLRDWAGGGAAKTPGLMFGTGLVAGAAGYWVSCPLFQAKTRLQALGTSTGTTRELLALWREGGARGLFRGAGPLVARGALLGAGQSLGYDGTKTALSQRSRIMRDGPALHALASVAAALLGTVLAAPADYVMTRYQAAAQAGRPFAGPASCLLAVLREDGAPALFRGWSPFFLRMAPAFVMFHPMYEQLRLLAGLSYMK
mmetsp:Transcript_4243/g.12054  ORF Transcript_4243/g.12054 Transcript_4243/m.12054 type:complete len:294 (+) Transcript_4243:69-950(+)|eukprot:CAMPEP_0176230902 /NCGR_PEP_ID=MMETSP0121_2-20121125/24530_1 /TAXON_ID=160619 /ORGANISM="Kryptoperidinium foliaceum, Strain CCMP 1326" /LENGTH=293 /DNA_ID=CAMNT_0017570243 /DNA_START=45 /DNA_END=926 /DNA_ORIENTATION=-